MSEEKKKLISLLKITLKLVESLTEEQCINLLDGKGKIKYEDTNEVIKKAETVKVKEDSIVKSYISKIEQLDNREEAYNYIQNLNLRKIDMVQISNQLNVHINKSDKKDIIVRKIIEATIGAKLRNETINNINLKME